MSTHEEIHFTAEEYASMPDTKHVQFEIKNAEYVDSDIDEYNPGYPLGSFRVSIQGRCKRVGIPWTIPVGEMTPIGRDRVRARSYKKDAEIIKNLKPGDLVDLFVNVWDANPRDARVGTFSLAHISRSNNA